MYSVGTKRDHKTDEGEEGGSWSAERQYGAMEKKGESSG